MKTGRYTTSRQKACLRCSAAKAKCDRKSGRCSRCATKDVVCTYKSDASLGLPTCAASKLAEAGWNDHGRPFPGSHESIHSASDSEAFLCADARTGGFISESVLSSVGDSAPLALDESHSPTSHLLGNAVSPGLNTSGLLNGNAPITHEFCCPIDAEAIRNRWLNIYLPVPGQKTKEYSASVTAFIYRILKAYTSVVTQGRGVPPFVHASQATPNSTSQPLATCLTLVRMCEDPHSGSEGVAMDILQREMGNIHDQHDKFDDVESLAAFQAYLIYSMVLFFNLCQSKNPILREAMMNLQHLASATSRRGLMCIAERERIRPRWEPWILMEAKRRTLYTMYLFDSVLSAQDGLPTALGTELAGLPASSNKQLWQANKREDWEKAYNAHLASLAQSLCIDELWPVPEGLNRVGLNARRRRVDLWLQEVDEYGTMLYAVTSCTHGG